MARSAKEDLFHSFRFWAKVTANGQDLLGGTAGAGFQAVTVPEYTQEAVEYREGHYVFTRKFVGLVTTADLTFSRGVTYKDTGFFDWLMASALGGQDYRADVEIYHFHRTVMPNYAKGADMPTQIPLNAEVGYRVYTVSEAIPTRVKPAGDLESMTSDVSIAEADVAYEWYKITDKEPL